MRITHKKEIEVQKEKMKTFMLMLLMRKSQLSLEEETLKHRLIVELYRMYLFIYLFYVVYVISSL